VATTNTGDIQLSGSGWVNSLDWDYRFVASIWQHRFPSDAERREHAQPDLSSSNELRWNEEVVPAESSPLRGVTARYPVSYPAPYNKLLKIACPGSFKSSKVVH